MSNVLANIFSGGKYSELQQQVNDLLSSNVELSSKLAKARESLKSNSELLIAYSNELKQKSSDINQKDITISKLQIEAKLLNERIQDCLRTCANKDNELKTKEDELKAKEDELNELRGENEKLKLSNGELSSNDCNSQDSDNVTLNELNDRIEVLLSEKLMDKDEIKRLSKAHDILKTNNCDLESNIVHYKEMISDLQEQIAILKKTENTDNRDELTFVVDNPSNHGENVRNDSFGAETLKIDKVIDVTTDTEIDAREFFKKPVDEIFHVRRELQDAIICNNPKFVCKYCGQMVKISGRSTERGRASFFSHLYDSDKCDLKTTTGLSRAYINAKKYGQYGESERHKMYKKFIEEALKDENSLKKGICDIQQEKTVFGIHPLFRWRRPDVYCRYNDIEIVFELQLSTTFASVIAERECFYKMNKIFLIWVFNFADNEEHVDLRNMMMKDIYFENHRNVFVIDEEAKKESLLRKELVLKCDWLEPNGLWHYSGYENYGSKGIFVTLSDLKYNTRTYKPYYHAITDELSLSKTSENDDYDSEMTQTLKLLDERYELLRKQKENEDEKVKVILAALDVDSISKTYKILDVAIVKKGDYYGIYNYKTNNEVLPAEFLSIKLWGHTKYFIVQDTKLTYTIYDQTGNEVLSRKYQSIPTLDKGCSTTVVHINEQGDRLFSVISYQGGNISESDLYNHIEKVSNDEYVVTKEVDNAFLKGIISSTGFKKVSTSYTHLNNFNNNLYHAVKNGKHGIIDSGEKVVLKFVYDNIEDLQDGKAKIIKGEQHGYIDSDCHPIFTEIIPLNSLPHIKIPQEKRLFFGKWWLFNCGVNPWHKGYEAICHYQGRTIAFTDNSIDKFPNIKASLSCGIKAIFKEKTKTGLLFAVGHRIVKMNRRQFNRRPEGVKFILGETYDVYVSCIKEELNLIYVSPIPCFGPN